MAFYFQLVRYHMENMLPGALAAAALYVCLRPVRGRRLAARGLGSPRMREGVMLLFWIFCGGMAMLTLTPPGFHWIEWLRYGALGDRGRFFALGDVNLIPFATLELGHQTRFTVFTLLGNIVMFVPFGLFAALLWRGYAWRRALGTGLCVTGFIECWQLLAGRAFDIDDVMLNTLGVLCGYWLCLGLKRTAPAFVKRFRVGPKTS